MIKVLQVKKFPIFDVFTGDGWLNWTRILIQPNKTTVIAGDKTLLDKNLSAWALTAPERAAESRKSNQKIYKEANRG